MSNYNSLITTELDAKIKANGNQEITGPVLNVVLKAMVSALGEGYQYKGIATTSTNPSTEDARVYYIAPAAGTYTNFGITITKASVLYCDGTTTTWHSAELGLVNTAELAAEAATRASADTTLQSNITSEASTRSTADTNLQTQVNARVTLATAQEITGAKTFSGGDENVVLGAQQAPIYIEEETWASIANEEETLQEALNAKEDVSNKKTSLTDNSDSYYPSQKAVKTAIDSEASSRASADTTLQSNITSEASTRASADSAMQEDIAELKADVAAINVDNMGDAHAKSMDMDELPKVCGFPMFIFGTAAPAVTPDFIGQMFIDTTNSKVYCATGVANAASFKALN